MRTWFTRLRPSKPSLARPVLRRIGLRLELLEARLAPALITVTTTADDLTPNDGTVSLREAITAINAGNDLGDADITAQHPGAFGTSDTIKFNIFGSAGAGPQINVGSDASAPNQPLPALTRPMVIDGFPTVGDAFPPVGFNNPPPIVINGFHAGPGANGFAIRLGAQAASSGVTIEDFVIDQFSANGILIEPDNITGFGATANTIANNFIGLNADRTSTAGNQQNGILIDATNSNDLGLAASDNVIDYNVISGNGNDGILIRAHNGVAAGNMLTYNHIGPTTPAFLPNAGDGITIDGASGNPGIGPGNVVSGNLKDGIHIIGSLNAPATANIVANNNVGVADNNALGNQLSGIEISGGNSNSIGGNVIGGNTDGIELDDGAQGNIIQGNFIGVGFNGRTALGNKQDGIALRSNDYSATPLGPGQPNEPGVRNNLIGGTGTGDGNTIAFNGSAGVAVFGNPISLSGQANSSNTIEGNSIVQNGRSNPSALPGIDLSKQFPYPKDDGVTPNDSGGHGAANDPNNLQNFPILSSVTHVADGTEIQGTFTESAAPGTTFRLEFFTSYPDPQNGVAEGQFFLGSASVTTSGSASFSPGSVTFDIVLPVQVVPGQVITTTATDPAGNTSEFSAGISAPTAKQFFVEKVYRGLLGREPEPAGYGFWTSQLDHGISPTQVVLSIETEGQHEYYSTLVKSFYQSYLHRSEAFVDLAFAAGMINFLASGGRIEQLRTIFTASPEYFQTRSAGTFTGYVNAVYLDAFNTPNRVATDPGAAAFVKALSNGTLTPVQFSNIIFTSDEYRARLVVSYFGQFGINSFEVTGWTALLNLGVSDQEVIAGILGSPEAFATAIPFPVYPPPRLQNPKDISPDLYGPDFSNIPLNGRPNINDLYVFRSPADTANTPDFGNTDIIATVSPFAGALTPLSFDQRLTLDVNIVNTAGDLTPDLTLEASFGPPISAESSFNQVVTLNLIQGNTTTTIGAYTYNPQQTIPPASFVPNVTFPGDASATGKFMAGIFDDPSFLDAQGYAQFARNPNDPANPFPRPLPAKPAQPLPTDAKNFYHNANTLAIVLEVPTVKLTTGSPPLLGVWADSLFNGTKVQRLGRPLVDALLIPPLPRPTWHVATDEPPSTRAAQPLT